MLEVKGEPKLNRGPYWCHFSLNVVAYKRRIAKYYVHLFLTIYRHGDINFSKSLDTILTVSVR